MRTEVQRKKIKRRKEMRTMNSSVTQKFRGRGGGHVLNRIEVGKAEKCVSSRVAVNRPMEQRNVRRAKWKKLENKETMVVRG